MQSAPRPGPDDVLVGEFGRAQGLRGEIRLKSLTGDPLAIAGYKPLRDAGGRVYRITSLRPAPGPASEMLVASVEGIADRTGAEALNGVKLYVSRALLRSEVEDEDEFLLADLIGLEARNASGEAIGRVVGAPDFGAGTLLDIAPAGGGASALVPFRKVFVPHIELAAGYLVVDAPDDLFAEAAASGEPDASAPDPAEDGP